MDENRAMRQGMEWQVCSLGLARKLKELGVKQESAFYWARHIEFDSFKGVVGEEVWKLKDRNYVKSSAVDNFAAFTVAELGEMLPIVGVLCYSHRLLNEWLCLYAVEAKEGFLQAKYETTANTETDARAKMLIYLIEHGIVKP